MLKDTTALMNRAKEKSIICTNCQYKKNYIIVKRIRYLKQMKWFWKLNQLGRLQAVEKFKCPKCGSTYTTQIITINDSIPLPREYFVLKAINPTYQASRGKTKSGDLKKPVYEYHHGSNPIKDAKLRKKHGDFIILKRIIDLENDQYYEKCTTEEGMILRECKEKLTEHQGRGSAKFKKA